MISVSFFYYLDGVNDIVEYVTAIGGLSVLYRSHGDDLMASNIT